MAFSVLQAGDNLYGMDQRGSLVALTLPAGVSIDDTLPLRTAVMGNYAILINSPSRPLAIDANLNVRVLCPNPPAFPVTLAGVAGGTLSTTAVVRSTFVVFDAFGNLIAESDYSPNSATTTISSQYLQASGLPISADQVNARRLYRTTSGTDVFFQWIDADGNTQTSSIPDDVSDAGLATFSAPVRGTPPDLYIVAEFKGRLFGASKADPNNIVYSEIGESFAWPDDNILSVPRAGSDLRGATGFARRRDAIGLGRSNGFYQITGTSDEDLRIVNISENCGIEATDSVAVYRDVAFFLWKDGVYRWDADGVNSVSDGKVRKWFTSNSTFNISRLQNAFGLVDPISHKYRLYLASAGSPVENCWIEYDFVADKWWGPHFSSAFNPTSCFLLSTDAGSTIPIVGATDGFVRMERKRRFDDAATGIDFDVVTAPIDAKMPDDEKYFGELSVATAPQQRGIMHVFATVGDVEMTTANALAHAPFDYDLRNSRQRLGRIGLGKAAKIRFRQTGSDEDVRVRGFEINPVNLRGKR